MCFTHVLVTILSSDLRRACEMVFYLKNSFNPGYTSKRTTRVQQGVHADHALLLPI